MVDMKALTAKVADLSKVTAAAEAKLKGQGAAWKIDELPACKKLLGEIKNDIATLPACDVTASEGQPISVEELLLTRAVWEMGAVISAMEKDPVEFEKHVLHLKATYYRDYGAVLPPSDRESEVMGLYLLFLLSSDNLGKFHTVIEHVRPELRTSDCVKYSLDLEISLMDGNYNKVVSAANHVPRPVFAAFMPELVATTRLKVAKSLEASYESVDVKHACKLLMLNDGVPALKDFAGKMNAAKEAGSAKNDVLRSCGPSAGAVARDEEVVKSVLWEVSGDRLTFVPCEDSHDEHKNIPSLQLIQNVIEYATKLERIV
eukprot:Selendium_serpulae@DN3369_c0_g1_i2.p1